MDSTEFPAHFNTNAFIFREGDLGDCAYIIDSGLVEVSIEKDSRKLVIATLSKGELLGEMAIIDKLPRTASARAVVPTNVTAIPLEYVTQKIEKSDPTIRLFLRLVMLRYRDLNTRLGHVFEGLSPEQETLNGDEYASTTMELKNVMSQYRKMQQRIDAAVTKPSTTVDSSVFGEKTLQDTKALVTEEQNLVTALKKKEFVLHYQPIIELESDRIVGCEALVRWNHPSGALFSPSRFISLAENCGLIINLGYWIAEEACRVQKRLCDELRQELIMSINLSSKQFEDPSLIQNLTDIMDRTGVRRESIKFEITESLLMDNPELAAQSLNELKETGAKLAIDDFGTGYSSFSYLYRFPFDTLKIDRAFVRAMLRNEKGNQIVKSLVNLSNDLGMDVVAEGIETKREAEKLREFKAEYGQGFLYSRPVAENEFINLLT